MEKKAIRIDLYRQVLMDAPEIPETIKTNIIPLADEEILDILVLKYNVPIHERIDEPFYREKQGLPELRKKIIKDVQERKDIYSSLKCLSQKKFIELQKLMMLVKEAKIKKDANYLRALFTNIQNLLAPWLWNTKIGEALRLIQHALDEADRIEKERTRMMSLPSNERQRVFQEHPEWFKR